MKKKQFQLIFFLFQIFFSFNFSFKIQNNQKKERISLNNENNNNYENNNNNENNNNENNNNNYEDIHINSIKTSFINSKQKLESHSFDNSISISNNHNHNNNNNIDISHSHHSHKPIWDFDSLETFKLLAKDGADGDEYGRGVAICGKNIIIGSSEDTFRGVQSGTAYVYTMGNTYEWIIKDKLYPSIGEDDDYFGYSVSCDKNITVVGSYGVDLYQENGGAVYLFTQQNSKFSEIGIFYPPEGTRNEYFGWSLAIHEHLLVVGAKGNNALYTQCGAVYIYRMLDSSQLDDNSNIKHDDDAYQYTPYGWVLDEILVPPSQAAYMNYGYSVSIYKNTLVVGAPRAEYSSGSVYVYVRNTTYDNFDDDQYYTGEEITYLLVSILQSPYPQSKSMFGNSVSIYGNLIVVGQYLLVREISGRDLHDDDKADDDNIYSITSGGAFLFKKDTISTIGTQNYPSSYPQQWGAIVDLGSLVGYIDYELFGTAVAVYHGLIAIGAPGDSVVGVNSSIYLYASESKDFLSWTPLSNWANFDNDRQYGKLGSTVALAEGLVLVGDPECYNDNDIQTGCAFTWWGVTNKKEDEGQPTPEIIISNKYTITWITLLIASITGCFLCCFYIYRNKRENVDIVLDDILHSDSQNKKMEYSQSTSTSNSDMELSNYPRWLHPYSNHSSDWLFGGNEMKPIRLGSIDASESSLESGSIDYSQSSRGLLSYFQRSSSTKNSTINEKSSILSRSSGIPASIIPEYRKRTQSDIKRIMATAKAIADDDSHPNQEDVAELIRTYERDWISDDRFIEEVQKYFI